MDFNSSSFIDVTVLSLPFPEKLFISFWKTQKYMLRKILLQLCTSLYNLRLKTLKNVYGSIYDFYFSDIYIHI